MLIGTARGLKALHGAGFAHLDIKPENLMMEPEVCHPMMLDVDAEDVKLGDFGMSQRVAPGKEAHGL